MALVKCETVFEERGRVEPTYTLMGLGKLLLGLVDDQLVLFFAAHVALDSSKRQLIR